MTAVYSRFSRINHSCAPSAVRDIEPSSGAISVRAAREVMEGEEITIKVRSAIMSILSLLYQP